MENISISTDKTKMDIKLIHNFLTNSYWAKNIPEWIVKKSVENSLCFGIFDSTKQFGFARIVTDFATFAYLADVFILEEYRGRGLSKMLMDYIMAYPELRTIRRWMLATRDAHGLYKKYGFKVAENPDRIMEITTLDFYNVVKLEDN